MSLEDGNTQGKEGGQKVIWSLCLLSQRPTFPERPQTSLPLLAAQTVGPVKRGWGGGGGGTSKESEGNPQGLLPEAPQSVSLLTQRRTPSLGRAGGGHLARWGPRCAVVLGTPIEL